MERGEGEVGEGIHTLVVGVGRARRALSLAQAMDHQFSSDEDEDARDRAGASPTGEAPAPTWLDVREGGGRETQAEKPSDDTHRSPSPPRSSPTTTIRPRTS